MVYFPTKKKAQVFAVKRRKGFRRLAKKADKKRAKFLRASTKTVKIRKLSKGYVVEGR